MKPGDIIKTGEWDGEPIHRKATAGEALAYNLVREQNMKLARQDAGKCSECFLPRKMYATLEGLEDMPVAVCGNRKCKAFKKRV